MNISCADLERSLCLCGREEKSEKNHIDSGYFFNTKYLRTLGVFPSPNACQCSSIMLVDSTK